VAQVVFDKEGSVEESRMNRMGDFFSIMMMTSITHADDVDSNEAISGLRSALQDTLSTGPEDDLCALLPPPPLPPPPSPPPPLAAPSVDTS
jgi:glycine cleavage system regulatory protein